MIASVSYSKLIDFEQCKYKAKLKHIDRIPEEKSEAADRGTMIHNLAEQYILGKLKNLPRELHKFEDEFTSLRAQYKQHKTKRFKLEEEWSFNKHWEPTDWKHAWLRMKADLFALLPEKQGLVVDYKTGKMFGNEIKHGEQVLLYAIAAFLLHAEIEHITIELWYLDMDQLTSRNFTRVEALRYMQPFDKRLQRVTAAKEFPANPNIFTCKWCTYGPNKGGQCPYGIASEGMNISTYRKKFG